MAAQSPASIANKEFDTSAATRELADISVEAVGALGVHLAQIGDIISQAALPPGKQQWGAAKKVQDKLEVYKAYKEEMQRRRAEVEARIAEDYRKMQEWRKEAGTEGADLVSELERLYDYTRELQQQIKEERESLAESREKIQRLVDVIEAKDLRWRRLAEAFLQMVQEKKLDGMRRAGFSSWIQCSYAEIRFRWKAEQERQKLKIEHHQRMRKARAQARLDVIGRERERRLAQATFLALQEELVECRSERHEAETRSRYDDHVLVLNAQLSQALGDEEKAKELVAEQVRRVEEAKENQRVAERETKLARRDAREQRARADQMTAELAKEKEEHARETARADAAEAEASAAHEEARVAHAQAAAAEEARIVIQQTLKEAEEAAEKKAKKIKSLQNRLAELGAESDSDAPPDERPPAFFINKDGEMEPRPRTRKERVQMAYREAESARWELRLGMAACIDKDINNDIEIKRLNMALDTAHGEISEVRWANEVLSTEIEAVKAEAKEEAERAAAVAIERAGVVALGMPSQLDEAQGSRVQDAEAPDAEPESPPRAEYQAHAPLLEPPAVPLSPSSSSASPFSPSRPVFMPASPTFAGSSQVRAGSAQSSPRGNRLLKVASQPVLMPSLHSPGRPRLSSEGVTLAPLRKVKRPFVEGWRPGWH